MIGLGYEFPVVAPQGTRQLVPVSADTAEHNQRGVVGLRLLSKRDGDGFRVGIVHFEIQNDEIGMMATGQFEPWSRPAGRPCPQTVALQRGLEHFPRFFRRINNQHTSLAIQRVTLRGVLRSDFHVRPPRRSRGRSPVSGKGPEHSDTCRACQSELWLDGSNRRENNGEGCRHLFWFRQAAPASHVTQFRTCRQATWSAGVERVPPRR